MPLKKSGGPVVGLDIGSAFIKACEIECRGGKANLRGIAVMPTPPECVANNEIVDPVALGKAMRQLLQQAGIRARKVVASVAGQSALVVRIIEVPKMTRSELQETMKWEIERHVPFAAEQVVMDYQPLVPPDEVPEGQNMEVLLAVAQENLVTRHVQAIQAAGLQPIAIDIEPLAASRALLDLANGAAPAGTVAIVDIGASSTDISIYRDGRIAFTRSIQLAGNSLTKAISDGLGVPLTEAERIKLEHASVPQIAPAAPGADLFGDQFGGLDFSPALEPGAPPLGGTFGLAPDPGAATATQEEPAFDIAGGGFSPEAFTAPTGEAEASASGEPSFPSLTPAEEPPSLFATPAESPFGAPPVAGPVPAVNPFDPDAAPEPAAPAASGPGGPNPFEAGLFGPTPAGDPFGGLGDFGFGAPPAPTPTPAGAAPAPMSEEELLKTQIQDAIMPVLNELVTELRRSLDFYRNRANGLGAQQVILTGGTAKLPGLPEFLAASLELPVVVGNPLDYVSAGPKADPNYLKDVGPVFPVSVGLAVRELLVEPPAPKKSRKR